MNAADEQKDDKIIGKQLILWHRKKLVNIQFNSQHDTEPQLIM